MKSQFYKTNMTQYNITMKPTARQISAVHFCEKWLYITYEGDINNRHQVSQFLSKYLEDAKQLYYEVACEYEAYLADLD